jgi:hypothetical protein
VEAIVVGGIVLVFVVVGIVLVLAIPLLLIARRRERRWAQALTAWAASLGFTAYPAGTEVRWTERLPGRRSSGVRYLFAGQRGGRTVGVAEYEYHETTSTSVNGQLQTSTVTHRYLVCVVDVGTTFPAIEVVERSSGSKLWRWLTGPKDTEIGVPEFDERYRIATDQPEIAKQLIRPALVQAHVAGSVPPWSLYGSDLLAYWPGRLEPQRALPALDALLYVADLFGK